MVIACGISPGALREGHAQDVIISEFLASNGSGLKDEDGDPSDWIEVQNTGSVTVNLGGWFLSDDPVILDKWPFPPVEVAPGEALLVFASGKNRSDPLHTNFQLSAEGEYLALVRPDGSVPYEYAPAYPPQRDDVSYGIAQEVTVTPLVPERAAGTSKVPTAEDPELAWAQPGFDDSGWAAAQAGVGYDLDDPGPSPVEPTNLALAGLASQSTTDFGGLASRAIDGNTDGAYWNNSTSHTSVSDPEPSWQVDLRATYDLERVVLWNRTDCCAERLSNFRLLVLDEGGNAVHQSDHFTDGGSPASRDYAVVFPQPVRGRIVRIEKLGPDRNGENFLSLAEVQVFELSRGYRGLIATDVERAMLGINASLLLRFPFEVADPAAFDVVRLAVNYDDGFIAYLNGREIARRNAPASISWDAAATAEHSGTVFEKIDVSSHLDALRSGMNLLAVRAMNIDRDDRNFLILPQLTAVSLRNLVPRYFAEPTPGKPNDPEGLLGFVADVRFSAGRGFYTAPMDVEISTETPGAQIRYTTDGTAPTAATGLVYTAPLRISKTTTLRAAAFKDGYGPATSGAQTYIYIDQVIRQKGEGFPAAWGGTPADYEMDPNVVDAPAYRDTIRDDLKTIPSLSIAMDVNDLFGPQGIYANPENRGSAWERPCSIELIYPDGRDGLQVNCGLQIFGYGWRSNSTTHKHALRVIFRHKYGPGKLDYPFFPDWPIRKFDDIVLRAQGSRGWTDFRPSIEQTCYIRDAWSRYTDREMGKLTTSSTYVHLYLNGLYWGLYNPVEHPDAGFMEEHLGGSEEDYDAMDARVGSIEILDGSRKEWDTLMAMARADVSTLEAYHRIGEYLDVRDLVDYMLLNFYTGNQDWVGSNGNNMRVAGSPRTGVGFKAFCWDMEYSIWYATDNNLSVRTDFDTPATLHARLRSNVEYRMLFADRVRKHFSGDGALTPRKTADRWMMLAGPIDRAIVGESARWGDYRREPPYTRNVEWVRERERLMSTYFPQRTGILLNQLTQAGLYPSVAAPVFSPDGGPIGPGFQLTVDAPSGGTIHYRLDGGDPRVPGGAVSADALVYGGPIQLSETTQIKARARSGSIWSALSEATFVADSSALRITEVMYHPAPPPAGSPFSADDFEFVELQNTGDKPMALMGTRISGGIEFSFPGPESASLPSLGPGEVVLVVKKRSAFESRYDARGLYIAGEYGGKLGNAGDTIVLQDSLSRTILDFFFSDDWYPATDGGGYSLEIVDPLARADSWREAASWRPSRAPGGTPGMAGVVWGLQRPGDLNQDGGVDISDAIALLGHLFLGAPSILPCGGGTLAGQGNRSLADANIDGAVDLTDAIYLLLYLFGGGPPPDLGTGCIRLLACPDACKA